MALLPAQTAQALDGLPLALAERLIALRDLILSVAGNDAAIGPLQETLKWGEIAFLPSTTKSGTTIRINRHQKSDEHYALYVHCQTDLVRRYRELYSDKLTLDGERAVVFRVDEELPVDVVSHCIAMALTYHLK